MGSVYSVVTDRIIGLLEEGVVPWQQPWSESGGLPRNLVSGKPYRGVNALVLGISGLPTPDESERLSYDQVQMVFVPRKGRGSNRMGHPLYGKKKWFWGWSERGVKHPCVQPGTA